VYTLDETEWLRNHLKEHDNHDIKHKEFIEEWANTVGLPIFEELKLMSPLSSVWKEGKFNFAGNTFH